MIEQKLTEKEMYLEILKDNIGFKYNPPTIDEFLDDPFYLGNHKVIPEIYPFWRKVLRELYPDNITTKSSTLVFTGAIGGGKSTLSAVITLYDICKMCCMREPLKYFNLGSLTGWKVKCFNVYKYKIQGLVDVLNEAITGGNVPFFERELRSGTSIINKITIEPVAKLKDLISDDVPIFHLSELNFCKPELAKDIINSSFSRLSARFIKGENLFTHVILDSSTTGPDSPVETFLREDPKSQSAMVVRVNAWNTKEGLGIYFNHGSFEVYAGDSQTNPFIVPDDFSEDQRQKYDIDRFVTVPNELRSEFERDIVLALQEKAGMSTASTSKFFTNKLRLSNAFCLQKHHDDIIRVDFFDPRDTVMKYLRDDVAELPKDRRLYIKIDCGVASDNFGLCVAYADGLKRQTIDGLTTERMLIKIPICVGINRYEGQETPINKVEDFILELARDREVALVLTDQYQSTNSRQVFIQNGIEAELQSVDRDDKAYMMLKNAIYSGLVEIADNQLTYREAIELERISPTKIDHPPVTGSKDTIDTIAGVVAKMIELGPEEVLAPPSNELTKNIVNAYANMAKTREENNLRRNTSASDYLAF